MAVRRENDALFINGGNALAHLGEHAAVFLWSAVAHGVRHINCCRAGFDGYLHHLHEEVALRAGGVFGRELDIVHQRARQAHALSGLIQRLGAAHLELVLEMQIARSQKDVDAGAVGELQGARGHHNVFGLSTSQRGDARLAYGLGNGGDGSEVALGSHGETGLNNVHAQIFQGMSHGQLFLRRHAAAGRLLAVAQCGIEKDDAI